MSVPSRYSLTSGADSDRQERGDKRGVVEYEFTRKDGSTQRVVLESGAKTPLPIGDDDRVLIALLTLSDLAGHPEVLRFEISHVLALLRRPDNPFNVRKVKRAIERFQRMSSAFEGVWFSRKEKAVLPLYDTGVIAESATVSKPGRRKKGERLSHVQWTKSMHESLAEGNLLRIDLEWLARWDRPGAMQLFRHLNKVWRGGRQLRTYERDLEELACGHLLMKGSKDLKRNFTAIVDEHEEKQYLQPLPVTERFFKSNGRWRVRFEPHPQLCAAKKAPERKKLQSDAATLVQAYHRDRFGVGEYRPGEKELACAQRLLTTASLGTLLEVTPGVAAAVKAAGTSDLYLGFAERFYEQQLRRHSRAKQEHSKRDEVRESVTQKLQVIGADEQAKRERRQRLLTEWQRCSPKERAQCVELALQRSPSQAYRDRILDSSLRSPAAEVLNELDRLPKTPASVSS